MLCSSILTTSGNGDSMNKISVDRSPACRCQSKLWQTDGDSNTSRWCTCTHSTHKSNCSVSSFNSLFQPAYMQVLLRSPGHFPEIATQFVPHTENPCMPCWAATTDSCNEMVLISADTSCICWWESNEVAPFNNNVVPILKSSGAYELLRFIYKFKNACYDISGVIKLPSLRTKIIHTLLRWL